jgi:hypothetical protein
MNRKEWSTVSSAALCMAASMTLSGCVTSRPVALPNGSEGLAIDCSRADNIADCMNYAAEKCGGPYRVFGQENRKVPHASGSGDTVSITNSVDRVLIVQCGKEETEQ